MADTTHLSTIEHGAYMLLLWAAWQRPTRSLADDDLRLARIAGLGLDEWLDMKSTIMAFWTFDGRSKTWTQKRLLNEAKRARKMSTSMRDKARKRWNSEEKTDAHASPQHREGQHVPSNGKEEVGRRNIPIDKSIGELAPAEHEIAPRNGMDLRAMVFSAGKALLVNAGKNGDQAGRIIGSWRKAHGDPAIIDAIARTEAEGASDPVSFITAILNGKGIHNERSPQRGASSAELFDQLRAEDEDRAREH